MYRVTIACTVFTSFCTIVELSIFGRSSQSVVSVTPPGIGTSTQARATRDLVKYLPVDKEDIEYASQSTLLRLAVNYVKIKKIIQNLSAQGEWSPTMDPISFFPGFILVLDSSAHILYASQNITKQIGPTLADTIGEPFGNLIHEDDSKKLEELGTLLIGNQQKQHMFAVRMKTNMSPTIRSQSKRTYKVHCTPQSCLNNTHLIYCYLALT
jgi:hypothetical protein